MIKCCHSLVDGLGMISLLSCLDDDQFSMRSPFRNFHPNWFQSLLLPFLAILTIIKNIFKTENINTDANSAKFCERNDNSDFRNDFFISKVYSLAKLKKHAKNGFKISLNELLIGVISKSFHQWATNYGIKDMKQVQMVSPFSMKRYPTSYEDF